MKIAVLADTHMPKRSKALPSMLVQGLQDVDLILHAGDWTSPEVVAMLERFAPVDGVGGNNDEPEIVRRFGTRKVLRIAGYRVGIIHGHGTRHPAERTAVDAFAADPVDLIVFGHSHIPVESLAGASLLFNPGSPTDKRRQPLYSYGIVELGDTIRLRHVFYADDSTDLTIEKEVEV